MHIIRISDMNGKNKLEDNHLWLLLRKGDREALSGLFKKYYKPLLNYGLSLVFQRELIKDSIQELFYTIWESRERLKDIEYIRPYLFASMRRMVYRQLSIQDRRHKRDELYQVETTDMELNAEQIIVMEELKKEKSERLRLAIQQLKGRNREAAFLKFYNGLSNSEIAEVMGVSDQSVYNYIYRAVTILQESLNISISA